MWGPRSWLRPPQLDQVTPFPGPRSIVLIDMAAHTTIAYAMNRMEGTTTGDMRAIELAAATWQALAAT